MPKAPGGSSAGRFWCIEIFRCAKASPLGSNGDDRRQRRKQGGAVGAAASRMRGPHQGLKQTLGAATRAVSLQSNDGEGKPGEEEPLHSDRQTLCQSETIAASMSLCQHPCPLRRSAPDSPFCRFATSSPGRGKSFLKGRAFSGGIIRSSLPPPPHGSRARKSSRCRRRRGQG